MARTPNPKTPLAADVPLNDDVVQAPAQLSRLNPTATAGAQLLQLGQLLGGTQTAAGLSKLADIVMIQQLAQVKETKQYRALAGQRGPDGQDMTGTWAEFCGLVDIHEDTANQLIQNLRAFGAEALEHMQRIGVGYRQLREFRVLPADEKQALVEVAEAGDKDAFIDLAETLIAKHSKEKKALQQRAEDAEANHEAATRVLSETRTKLDNTRQELARAKRHLKTQEPAEKLKQLRIELGCFFVEIEAQIQNIGMALDEHIAPAGEEAAQLSGWLGAEIRRVRELMTDLLTDYELADASDFPFLAEGK